MKRKSKIAITAALILAALPVLILVGAEIVINSAEVKSEIEDIVGEALDMAFKIEGRIDIRCFPLISLAVDGVTVGMKTVQIASADQIVIEPRLLPLLYREIQLKDARIHHVRLAFHPHAIDKIMALVNTESDGPLPVESLAIESFAISDSGFNYADDQTVIEFNELNFRGGRIEIIKNREVIIDDIYQFFKTINFTGDMAARQISSRNYKLENLRAQVKNENGILTADPVMLQYFGSDTKLRASLDFRQAKSTFESTLNLSGLNLGALAGKYFPAVNLKSKVDITSKISAGGIQLEKLVDYLSNSDQPAAQKTIPIKSVIVKAFTVAAKDLFYANDTIIIQQAGLNLKGNRWALIENNRSTLADFVNFLKATEINGRTTIKNITFSEHIFENLQANISNDHGIIKSDPIDLEYFGEQARLGLDWDLSKPAETIQLRIDMPDINTGRFLKRSDGKDILDGKLTIKAELDARGTGSSALVENINGHASMHGTNLTLKGVDFDKALDEFQNMGAYGFHDLAALITLGPLGTMVSHGYDQLEALEKMMAVDGDSTIEKIVSDWKVINGVATASDVAFSTKRHRMAIAGRLDFPGKRFQKVTLAVVDPNGCVVNKETVDGPFKNPEVKETGVVQRTVIRPLKSFLKSDCESFYSGSVAHPTAIQSK
jgi:hypothetical protein